MVDALWTDVSPTINGVAVNLKTYKQQHGESCGPSALCILIYVLQTTTTAESIVRLWCTQAEKALIKADPSFSTGSSVGGTDARVFDFTGGSRGTVLMAVLNKHKSTYKAHYSNSGSDILANIGKCTLTSPGIIRSAWEGSSAAHWIVCLGSDGAGNRVYLDLWYGLVSNTTGTFPKYAAPDGSRGDVTHLINTKWL
jgi:hypothetical protein